MRKEKNEKFDYDNESQVEKKIDEFMKIKGWVLPTAIEDVQMAEIYMENNPISLPKDLLDPFTALEKGEFSLEFFMKSPTPKIIFETENLSRVARDGKQISEEIEKIMHEDRKIAEKKAKNEHDKPHK